MSGPARDGTGGPARDVRWGFLGAGNISGSLAAAVHGDDGAHLHAVAARDPRRAARLGPVRVHATYDDLIGDPDVDAVYVGLANDAHLPWTLAALAAGKPVLCEKPLALSAAEVREIILASERAGLPVVEAVWNRWHPRTRRAQALVQAGALGRVRRAEASFVFDGVGAGNYRLDPARGGGALLDVGCYAAAGVSWAFGWAEPTGVDARLELGPSGVDLRAQARLHYAAGTGMVRAGMTGPAGQMLVIEGEQARLSFGDAPFTSRVAPATLQVGDREEQFAPCDPYLLMVAAFGARLREEPAYLVPLEQSLRVAEILDAVRARAERAGPPGWQAEGP